MSSQSSRRPVFDPLVDGVIARGAGKTDAEIAQMMHDAGLTQPAPKDVFDQVLDVALSPEGRAWKAMSPKERSQAGFAAQKAKPATPGEEDAAEIARLEAEAAAWDRSVAELEDDQGGSIWDDEPEGGAA